MGMPEQRSPGWEKKVLQSGRAVKKRQNVTFTKKHLSKCIVFIADLPSAFETIIIQ